MPWPTSTAISPGQTAGVSTTFNALRADLAATNVTVKKTVTESVTSSTVLQNDDELFYAISNTGTYYGELNLPVLCSPTGQTGDIKFGFSFPTGNMAFNGIGPDVTMGAGTTSAIANFAGSRNATSGSTALSYATTASATVYIRLWFEFVASATGTLRLMWAQDVSNANSAQVLSGAWMRVQQVA